MYYIILFILIKFALALLSVKIGEFFIIHFKAILRCFINRKIQVIT